MVEDLAFIRRVRNVAMVIAMARARERDQIFPDVWARSHWKDFMELAVRIVQVVDKE